ncbi:MAG: sulfotransferase [Nitrospirota bacterium]|nr:sulfotransferase [Nitrospirota bacterium]
MSGHLFIVGAQRCGTTWLYQLLDQHPQIVMARPVRPEPKFFSQDALYERGLDYYEQTFFAGLETGEGIRYRGEKSTSYLDSDEAAERIARHYPDARILILVRDPVARAVSHWRFSVENAVENLPIEEAFSGEEARLEAFDPTRISVSPYAYLTRGRYIEGVERYARHFPASHIHVLVNEQLVGRREAVRELYQALGVDASFQPAGLDQRVNASSVETERRAALSPELEAWARDYFAGPTARLEAWLGRPIPEWRRGVPR